MEFEKLITERYSVRKFKEEQLSRETVEKIISAAHKAPTGCNYQPQRILVINKKESMDKLRNCTKCHFNAPAAMLVCYNRDETWKRPYDGALSAPVDAAIVATHMILAAHDAGAGCCWVMHFNPNAIKETFNIPENIVPLALLVMGYPAEDSRPLELHSKVRPIDEVVFYDSF
ncbi:MAG: nitroreductase family protein [Clostridia bacterium]|nr:nitroreductase family protein [Clostridia bacterium]